MKVKSILKINSATKVEIIESVKTENGERLISHDIDIVENKMNVEKMTDTWFKYGHQCLLPKHILNSEVELISVNSATNALTIYTK